MNCELFREYISEYLEGALPQADAAAAEQHRGTCAECQAFSSDFAKLDRFLGTLAEEEDVSPDLLARLHDIPRTHGAGGGGRVIPFRPRTWVAAAAAAAAIIITVVLISRPTGPTETRVVARLYANRMAGRPVRNATYRIYRMESKVFHDLQLLNTPGARSWNNLHLRDTAPQFTATSDADGRLVLDEPLDGARLALVEKPGHLAAWGILEPVGDGAVPDGDVVLFPARSFEVRGTLVDASSRRPIKGAFVATLDGTGVARTNEHGEFEGRFMFASEIEPRVYALAQGYAEASAIVPGNTPPFRSGLTPMMRPSADVNLVDADGGAVRNMLALAYPDPKTDAQRGRIPAGRLNRPELALSDDDGILRFRNLFDCPYRLEFLQGLAASSGQTLLPHKPMTVALRRAGDGRMRVSTHRGDDPVAARVVFTPSSQGARPTPFLEGSTDTEGLVSFSALLNGPGTLHIYDRAGHEFSVSFTVTATAEITCEYPVPATPHDITGTMSDALHKRFVTIRLEGTLDAISIGGTVSSAHSFATETPIHDDGTFRFPSLPSLTDAKLSGRLRGDPYADPVPLRTSPALEDTLTKGKSGPATMRVQE